MIRRDGRGSAHNAPSLLMLLIPGSLLLLVVFGTTLPGEPVASAEPD